MAHAYLLMCAVRNVDHASIAVEAACAHYVQHGLDWRHYALAGRQATWLIVGSVLGVNCGFVCN